MKPSSSCELGKCRVDAHVTDNTAAHEEVSVAAAGDDIPLAVMLPLGELLPKAALLRLAVTLPLGELLLPYPKPAGSVRRPWMWPLAVMPPEDGDPLAVMLPLKGKCKPAKYRLQSCRYFEMLIFWVGT